MLSSSSSAQLALWREIVSKHHEKTKPVEQHLDFIRKCFDDLDTEGFIWSKESILGTFLQLGLPESSHDSSSTDSGNQLNEPRARQESEISSDEVEQVIPNGSLQHTSRPRGLLALPFEIVENIIERLDSMVKLEAEAIYDKKFSRRVMIPGSGDRKSFKIYIHNKQSPIFNSLQSFSLISPGIYQQCRPWLWRVSRIYITSLMQKKFLIINHSKLNFRNYSFQLPFQHK